MAGVSCLAKRHDWINEGINDRAMGVSGFGILLLWRSYCHFIRSDKLLNRQETAPGTLQRQAVLLADNPISASA